jgi:gluconolactonase
MRIAATTLLGALVLVGGGAEELRPAPAPEGVLDLMTSEGVAVMGAQWRVLDARVVTAEGKNSAGQTVATFDIEPRAGAADFDDSGWEVADPTRLDDDRRGGGKLCFTWYRINLMLPERIGDAPVEGATIAFETVVDDYAEVWVNGQLPIKLGAVGGQFAAGFNAPNIVTLTTDAKAGEKFQIAVFGANAPLSAPPGNFVFVRSALLRATPK